MASGNETKVDTKLFASTADTIGTVTKDMSRHCADWNKTMINLRGAWQGDVSDDIKNTVAQVQKSSNELVEILSGYQAALKEIAGIYDKTEKNVAETGKTLKFDRAMR